MIKVFSELLSAASLWKQTSQLRYYLALRIIDQAGAGWLMVEDAQKILAFLFGVKQKTVLNNLYKVQKAGFGTFSNDRTRFYYVCQQAVLTAICEGELKTNHAVWVGIEHLTDGTFARAFFETAPLAHNNTMSRKTREKIGGRTPRTQRKYEEELGIVAKRNCAELGPATEYNQEAAKQCGIPTFIAMVHGQPMLMRHLPTSYTTQHHPTRKFKLDLRRHTVWANRIFFDDVEKAIRAWDEGKQEVYVKKEHGPWGMLGLIPQ